MRLPIFALALVAAPALAQDAQPTPTLPDLISQAIGTANEAGFNPITLDPETRAKASIGGQILTSAVAVAGCPETAQTVGKAFDIAIQVAE